MTEMAVYGGGLWHSAPENKNTRDCGRDDGMMGVVGGRDAKMVDSRAAEETRVFD